MKPKKRRNRVNYDLPYSGTTGKSMDREIARRKWESRANPLEKRLGSVEDRDVEGNWIRRTKLSSPAEYQGGGKVTTGLPFMMMARKLMEMMKGKEEKPIIIRHKDPDPDDYAPSRWIPTKEDVAEYEAGKMDTTRTGGKQSDIMTNMVIARLLQGKR